ncbi:MAG TPA: BolA family transcriptional regulator [Thermopetrobacter sp.]|nr:BolA family transcriptional regulator [Thermopetrobacter sp.]
MTLGPVGRKMEKLLRDAFAPETLRIIDDSHKHAGHAGAHPEGESHFTVNIVAAAFAGKSLIERHRMVNDALADLPRERVHALSISAKAPGE